ncbi:hypothetical protein AC579_5124 [Pseudocercospora musae]|uniref:Uncharacterized protein n=1 Tax=Pseudocercospora musae TaxID=113226 RepID=A0A139INY6_9PEZI|nr:hypothetical protein AC579_5124 [Pseudocercospora musae]
MSTIATLETEAIVNYLHADIIMKNRSQIQFALSELKRLEHKSPTGMFEKLITRFASTKRPKREDNDDDDSNNNKEKKRAELQSTIEISEAELRRARVIQNQIQMVSGVIIVVLTAKSKLKEVSGGMLHRIGALTKTLTSSALAKEVECAREALEMRSLRELAEERARNVEIEVARSAFLKVEGKWEAMRALGEWEGLSRRR